MSASVFQRELEVLGSGTVNGVTSGLGASWSDLNEFGSKFKSNPWSAVTGYFADHWAEAAVAGGIAFLAPRKNLHWLLLAASGRGILVSGFEAATSAADTNIPLSAIKDRYEKSIAGETRSFVDSLPCTIVGGVGGRSLGNAVFGRGFGALDLASGKVSMADVRSNLWRLHDKIRPPQAELAVIDLDGTLVSTSRHLAVGIEQGNHHLASATGLSYEVVSDLMAEQFRKLKSFSNPWTVELALAERAKTVKGLTYEQFKATVSDPYWKILDQTMAENLRVYEGVSATLDALKQKNLSVMLLTNSPESAALPRLRRSGLDSKFDLAVMLENANAPTGLAPELVQHGADRLASWLGEKTPGFYSINRSLAKPRAEFLADLMRERNLRPSQVMVIGDSMESDMALASNSGTRGLWARWGSIESRFDQMLNQVTKGNFPPASSAMIPHEVSLWRATELLNHLRGPVDLSGAFKLTIGAPHWLTPLESYGYSQVKR